MQSVGERLKKARLEKGESLDEVYRQTKIYPRVLKALEEDRAHNFLSLTYIKGFLKTYAQYLGLDSEKLIKDYIDNQNLKPSPTDVVLDLAQEKEKKTKKSLPQLNLLFTVRIILIIVFSFAFVFYFRYVLKRFSAQRKAQVQKVKVEVTPAPVAVTPAAGLKREDLILEVRTKEKCWIRVKSDNQVIFEQTLAKGEREQWQAKEKIELRIGRPEALEVFCNGRKVDLKQAQVKRTLLVTHEGIQGK